MPPATSRKPIHLAVVLLSFEWLQVGSGNLNGPRQHRDILETVVVPHCDIHAIVMRPVLVDDNARLQQRNAITIIPWPARSPDLNSFNNFWDILGQRVRHRDITHSNIYQNCQQYCTSNPTTIDRTSGPGREKTY